MAGTQVVVGTRHGIAKKLLAGRQTERHVLEKFAMHVGRKGAFRNQRPPGRIARVTRRHIRRTLLSNRRPDPIRAHEQIRLNDFAIGKMRVDSVPTLPELRQSAPTMILSWRKSVPQEAIDAFPGCKHLRTMDFMCQAPL